jgi:hypothetical protein
VPWCEHCSKYHAPSALNTAGACPGCGTVIAAPARKAPWHFKLMLFGTAVYMVYRIYWIFFDWLPHH